MADSEPREPPPTTTTNANDTGCSEDVRKTVVEDINGRAGGKVDVDVAPSHSWRDSLSDGLLESAAARLKIPPSMDVGATAAFEELKDAADYTRDQFDRRSGFRKPSLSSDDDDDDDE
jgi:hypothetical protein